VWMPWKPNNIALPDGSTSLVVIELSLCVMSHSGVFFCGYHVLAEWPINIMAVHHVVVLWTVYHIPDLRCGVLSKAHGR
jgi:hypothetical protein